MKSISYLCFFVFLCLSNTLKAQDLTLIRGADLQFKTTEDYDNFEDKILLCIDWLQTHTLDHKERINATSVFLTWIKGTPTHTVYYEDYIFTYSKKNPEFFVLFLSGWAKYLIENQGKSTSDLAGNLAGVNSFLDFYKKGETFGVVKDKKVERLLKKRTDNKLERFIAVQIRR